MLWTVARSCFCGCRGAHCLVVKCLIGLCETVLSVFGTGLYFSVSLRDFSPAVLSNKKIRSLVK